MEGNMAEEIAAKSVQLTGLDIDKMRSELDSKLIIAPYDKKNATGCGYNLTATEFIYSTNKKGLLPLHKSKQGETYVRVGAHDTILLLTREYIKLNGALAGAIYSRVQLVSNGFGHISTTVDPGWKGMLLLSINNPTKKTIKLLISEPSEGSPSYKGVATLVLTPVGTEGSKNGQADPSLDNPAMRLDILKKLVFEPRRFAANKKYQNLRQLIIALEGFSPNANLKIQRLNEIRSLLLKLESEVNSYMDVPEVNGYLTELKRIDYEGFEALQIKILDLCNLREAPLDNSTLKTQLLEHIESGYRECDYQILSEQVSQIHQIIQKRVPYVWKYHTIRRFLTFWGKYWKILVLYGITFSVMALLHRNASYLFSDDKITALITVAATIVPPFITYLLERSSPSNEHAE